MVVNALVSILPHVIESSCSVLSKTENGLPKCPSMAFWLFCEPLSMVIRTYSYQEDSNAISLLGSNPDAFLIGSVALHLSPQVGVEKYSVATRSSHHCISVKII